MQGMAAGRPSERRDRSGRRFVNDRRGLDRRAVQRREHNMWVAVDRRTGTDRREPQERRSGSDRRAVTDRRSSA